MRVLLERCYGCGICVAVCPFMAVVVEEGTAVFLDSCTDCDICAQACPTGAILQEGELYEQRWAEPASFTDTT